MTLGQKMASVWETLPRAWPAMTTGTIVVVIAAAAGWLLAQDGRIAPVRFVLWWVRRVVEPLIRMKSWAGRALTIFINNTAVCGILVLAGASTVTSWAAIILVGVSLGVGLHSLSKSSVMQDWTGESDNPPAGTPASPRPRAGTRTTLGVALNLLEFPAIVITLGLCLGRHAMPAGWTRDVPWTVFVAVVIPLLFVAAAGEALWMGDRGIVRPTIDERATSGND